MKPDPLDQLLALSQEMAALVEQARWDEAIGHVPQLEAQCDAVRQTPLSDDTEAKRKAEAFIHLERALRPLLLQHSGELRAQLSSSQNTTRLNSAYGQ